MLLDTIFAPFVKERPICVMARAVLERLLDASGLYRFFWHRALLDLAIYVILLAVVTAAAASGERGA